MRITKILGFVAIVAVALAVSSPADANCIPNKTAATFGNGGGAYWILPAGASTEPADLVGRFWQQGNRAAGNEGTYSDDIWLYFYPPGGGVAMQAFLGTGEVAGCPANRLITVAQTKATDGTKAYFLAATIDEVSGPAVDFAYENLGNLNLIEIPKPFVVNSSRVGTAVNLTVNVPAVQTGLYGPGASTAVTGYRILSATGTADPGRNATAYQSLEATATSSGADANGIALDVDCTNTATDRWLVTQIQFDQGVTSDVVSQAVRVNCNPALADPRFKLIDKKPSGKREITKQ